MTISLFHNSFMSAEYVLRVQLFNC